MVASKERREMEELSSHNHLAGGFQYFYFHPYLGKIPILTNIFQMGWFNHQLVMLPFLP